MVNDSLLIHEEKATTFSFTCYRDSWTIYRWPGFLAVVWIGSSPTPSPLSRQHVVCLSLSSSLSLVVLIDGRGGGAQIIRPQESPVFYKSFNTLCVIVCISWEKLGVKSRNLHFLVSTQLEENPWIYLIIHTLFLYKYHKNIGSTFNVKK